MKKKTVRDDLEKMAVEIATQIEADKKADPQTKAMCLIALAVVKTVVMDINRIADSLEVLATPPRADTTGK